MKCNLSEERASAQIRIEQHSNFRWRSKKAWKQCLVWFWIDCNQSLQPNRSPMKCNVWKQSIAAVNSFDRTSFHFQFEDFLSNLPLWTIIYCVTDQPSITWSWRSVLNFKFSVLSFLRSMSCLTHKLTVCWMRVDIDSQLSSISAFKKNSNPTQLILGLQSR